MELREGDSSAALRSLRTALDLYQRLDAPYHAAQVRLMMADACAALGDEDGHKLERRAARATLRVLGAPLDDAAAEVGAAEVGAPTDAARPKGVLSEREIEVLRCVAAGDTNKQVAAKLFLSVKTVDRHLSNIFRKLAVSSRAEATASAIRNNMI